MVTVNIDEKLWKEFMKQSIDLGKSASGRISDYMKKELKKVTQNPNNKNRELHRFKTHSPLLYK